MARPIREGMEYFPHDTDAVNDEKLEVMMSLYGGNGYCFYFVLLERIYRTSEYELNVSEAETIRILSRKVAVSEEEFELMLGTALKYGLFDSDEYKNRGVLTSKGIKKRSRRVEDKRAADRNRYEKSEGISEAKTHEGKPREKTTTKTTSKVKDRIDKYSPEFLNFYAEYPRPEDMGRSFKNWKRLLKEYSVEQLMGACRNYKAAQASTEKKYLKNSANFLGQDRSFEDYLPKDPSTQIQLKHRVAGMMGG